MDLQNDTRKPAAQVGLFSAERPAYWHRQHAPWSWLLYGIAAIILASAVLTHDVAAGWIMLPSGSIVCLLATAFHHLTVKDLGQSLSVRFGPVPLFGMSIPYTDILSVTAGRTTLLDGWGIHYSLRGGQVWNVWGRECVVIHRRRSILRLGTDDMESLLAFLQSQLTKK